MKKLNVKNNCEAKNPELIRLLAAREKLVRELAIIDDKIATHKKENICKSLKTQN